MERDRYRYFRVEARELLEALSQGVLQLEKAPADRELVARLLRHAHTLKGAARIVQQQPIAALAHELEDALAPHRDPDAPPLPHGGVDALLRALDGISAELAALGAEPQPKAPSAAAADEDLLRSVRLDVGELDALLESALEAGVQVTGLRRQLAELDHAGEIAHAVSDQLAADRGEPAPRAGASRLRPLLDELRRSLGGARRGLRARADEIEREILQVRNSADRLRLVPVRALFGSLERAVRDAARSLDRGPVAFEAVGGDVRVDASVLAAMRDALLHVVRNAVAHGIEPAPERRARGKSASGRVRLEVARRGGRVAFVCADDGAGVDVDAIRAAAVRKGRISPAEARALDGPAVASLLLRGGLSTSPAVSDVAGRGVGLDVLRDTAARLNAEVSLRSEPGRGTAVDIAVPVSLTAMKVLHLECNGTAAALPLDAVRRTVFLPAERVTRTGGGAGIAHDGQLIPFLPLGAILDVPERERRRRFWAAAIVVVGARLVAVGADRLAGTSDVIVRPLPAFLDGHPAVAGASLDSEGNPQLILDPSGLEAALPAAAPAEAPSAEPLPILVVDDSLTTRMLEQSILESAGYQVEVAVSGEEALQKARARRFGLFVVDIEMPGMDGIEFVRVTRGDPRLSATPAILVTSRGAPEDRRRGLDAGASAYIVKSEFNQGELLATIGGLVA